jgi:predicted CoA-binding protein
MEALSTTSDAELREIFERCRAVAVVGMKGGADDDAFRVPRYMQAHGYRILPVSPKLERVLGERVFPSLAAVDVPIDLVDLFRAPQHLPAHVDEILALDPLPFAVWFQLGIRRDESAHRLRDAGIRVVQDRCLMVEHRRLLGGR